MALPRRDGVLTIGLLIPLFYWTLAVVEELDVLATVFWILWPNLVAFLPIGLAMRGGASWPRWGAVVYDATHSFLVWGAGFGLAWAFTGSVPWSLLGWAVHIGGDAPWDTTFVRAVDAGFGGFVVPPGA